MLINAHVDNTGAADFAGATDRLSGRARHQSRRSERGSALLISLFIILTMSGLGIVAIQASSTGLVTSRSQIRQSISRSSADSGASMAVTFMNDRGFASVVAWQLRQSIGSGETRRVIFNAHSDALPGAQGLSGEARFASDAVFGIPREGQLSQSFQLVMSRQWPPVNVEGSEVGTFCRERVRIDGTGFAWPSEGDWVDSEPDEGEEGSPATPIYEPDRVPPPTAARTSFMLYALTPPVLCQDS